MPGCGERGSVRGEVAREQDGLESGSEGQGLHFFMFRSPPILTEDALAWDQGGLVVIKSEREEVTWGLSSAKSIGFVREVAWARLAGPRVVRRFGGGVAGGAGCG